MHFDELAKQSLDPKTPADERWDMNAEIHAPGGFARSLDYPPPADVLAAVQELYEDQEAMAKAVHLTPQARPVGQVSRGAHQSILYLNDMGVVGPAGVGARYYERPGAGFAFLKTLNARVDVINAIKLNFTRKVSAFCLPESDESPLGFKGVRIDGQDMTDADRREWTAVERMILDCGDEHDPVRRRRLRRDNMQAYVKKLIWDSLSADACPVELQGTQGGKLSGWYSVPFDTTFLCSEEGYEGDDEICAVQVIDGIPQVAFTYDELAYDVRNPRSDLEAAGYGHAEPEMMVKAMTGYINAISFNHSGMDSNAAPRGIFEVFGDYSPAQQVQFRKKMTAMLHGVASRWTVPIFFNKSESGKPGVHWTPIDKFDEMMFARWIVLQASIAGALYGMDPAEFSFDSFALRQSGGLQRSELGDKLAHSKSKGLEPLLRFLETHYNTWIVPRLTKKFRVEFIGLQVEDSEKKSARIEKSSTYNELRHIDGREPMKSDLLGDAPADAAAMQVYMLDLQQKMGGAAAGPDNAPPADDEEIAFADQGDGEDKGGAPMTKAQLPGVGTVRSAGNGVVVIERDVARDSPRKVEIR